jgi:hypothetical protein
MMKDKVILFCPGGRQNILNIQLLYLLNILDLEIIFEYDKLTKELKLKIRKLAEKYSVPLSNIALDYDGIGTGIVDELECVAFQAGSSPIYDDSSIWGEEKPKPNFRNLRTQCWIYFAEEIVNKNKLFIDLSSVEFAGDPLDIQEQITDELDVMKEVVEGGEYKRQVISKGSTAETNKQTIKQLLGRSPDFGDGLMMRAIFDIRKTQINYSSLPTFI